MIAAILVAPAAVAMGSEYETCFQKQVGSITADNALTRASVLLKIVTQEGRTIAFGTGTIIRNSGDQTNPHNRVLTAYHVARPDFGFGLDGLKTIAVGSDGVELGEMSLVSRASANEALSVPGTRAEIEAGIAGSRAQAAAFSADMAVLAISSPGSGGWTPYDRREGVELSKRQSAHVLTGLFADPGGVEHGASGGGSR